MEREREREREREMVERKEQYKVIKSIKRKKSNGISRY